MLKAMIETLKKPNKVSICDLEIEDETLTQTYRSVDRLAAMYPDRQFRFVFGADSYRSMTLWSLGDKLWAELQMLVVPRMGIEFEARPNIQILDAVEPHTSTEVRSLVCQELPAGHLVCSGVETYIAENKLYQDPIAMA